MVGGRVPCLHCPLPPACTACLMEAAHGRALAPLSCPATPACLRHPPRAGASRRAATHARQPRSHASRRRTPVALNRANPQRTHTLALPPPPLRPDDSYDRSLYAPGTNCTNGKPNGSPGAEIVFDESIDIDNSKLNAGEAPWAARARAARTVDAQTPRSAPAHLPGDRCCFMPWRPALPRRKAPRLTAAALAAMQGMLALAATAAR